MFLFYIFCYNLTWTSFLCSTFILHVYVLSDLRAVHLVYVYFMMLLKWVKFTQSCLALCNPIDYTVHEILQARILEWVAIPFSRWSSQSRDKTQISCIAGGFFTSLATREAPKGTLWLHGLGIESGPPTWQVGILPLNHSCTSHHTHWDDYN